jgi:hypothetical protein
MPNRIVRDGFIDSERVNRLSWFAECVYHRMILIADDAGRMDGRIRLLNSRLFPIRTVSDTDLEQALAEIEKAGLITKWCYDGLTVLQITKWRRCSRSRNAHYPDAHGDYRIRYVTLQTSDGMVEFVDTSIHPPSRVAPSCLIPDTSWEPLPDCDRATIPAPSHSTPTPGELIPHTKPLPTPSGPHTDPIVTPSGPHTDPIPTPSVSHPYINTHMKIYISTSSSSTTYIKAGKNGHTHPTESSRANGTGHLVAEYRRLASHWPGGWPRRSRDRVLLSRLVIARSSGKAWASAILDVFSNAIRDDPRPRSYGAYLQTLAVRHTPPEEWVWLQTIPVPSWADQCPPRKQRTTSPPTDITNPKKPHTSVSESREIVRQCLAALLTPSRTRTDQHHQPDESNSQFLTPNQKTLSKMVSLI